MHSIAVSFSWRKLLRFSIRGLIALVLVLGVGLGWLVRKRCASSAEAVAAIIESGGLVKYNWGWTRASSGMVIKRADPGWLANLIGIEYIGHVTDVWLTASGAVTETTLMQVGRLTRLEKLRLDQATVNDAWLAHLAGLARLKSLNLEGTRVTDVGLAHLTGLTELRYLDVVGTKVTGAGIERIQRRLPRLIIEQ